MKAKILGLLVLTLLIAAAVLPNTWVISIDAIDCSCKFSSS